MITKSPSLLNSLLTAAAFAAVLWAIKLCEMIFHWQLFDWGVYPQATSGLVGILSAPLIHGSWQHVAGNTMPLILLGGILLYGYPKARWWTLAIIWVLSGLGVWLIGRESYHFGASGLTHGMFFYLLVSGILRRDKRSVALLMVAFYMYGSMVMTIFPREPGISFEYHLFGGIAGTLCAIAFRHWDAKPVEKTYDWEGEDDIKDDDDENSIIGDLWLPEEQRAEEQRTQEQRKKEG